MSSLTDLARIHTELDSGEISYLQRLVAGWNLLADLSFADLILFAPVGDVSAGSEDGRRVSRFVALAQIRPSTVQTIYDSDWVGTLVEAEDRPVVTRSFSHGQIIEGEIDHDVIGERLRVMSVPIRCGAKVIGVLSRESVPSARRSTGALERSYAEIFNRLARMISAGRFPFPGADRGGDDVPRVGDGSVLLDREGRVVFCSPNASSALHRMGAQTITEQTRVTVGGLFETVIRPAFSTRLPVTEEIDVRHDAVVLAHCVPLLEPDGTVTNGLLLLRDISELKRLDRLLMSKDATIREIHHRVKNNLQTISSLLRLQARRTASAEAKAAIEESVRRIGAIALVHETLSREAGGRDAVSRHHQAVGSHGGREHAPA